MTERSSDIQTAWGVQTIGGRTTVARVSREDDGWSVELTDDAASMNGQHPKGVCLDDADLLYRRLELPTADRVATQDMVTAQIEALLPGRSSQFRWTWDRCEATGHVWLCAARQETIDNAADDAGKVATLSAVAAGLRVAIPELTGRVLVIHPNSSSTTMLVVDQGRLECGCILEPGLATWQERPAACAVQVREALDAELSNETQPRRLLLLAEGLDVATIAQRLGLTHSDITQSPNAKAVAAIGAALTMMGAADVSLDLAAAPVQKKTTTRRTPRLRHILIVWLLLAIVGLYIVDLRRAEQIKNQAATALIEHQTPHNAAKRLSISRFLDGLGAPPLAVLDDISNLAGPQIQLHEWHYGHREGVRFRGIAPNGDELNKLLEALGKAKALEHIELVRQKLANDKCEFEITAKLRGTHAKGGRR